MQEVPQSARQFEYHQMKLLQQRQILNSWRGERDSNQESGGPYPFKKSNEFRKLRTRDLLRADVMQRRSRPLARLVRARTSKTDLGSGLFRHPGHALCCLSPAFSARWPCRFCRRLASIHGLGAFELLGSDRAIRTGGLRQLRTLAFGSIDAV